MRQRPGAPGSARKHELCLLFRHALIQEATYLALLRAERRDLHARAARALEAAAAGRLPEVAAILGRHYATAENADRAVYYLELAGGHATDAFANDEAIALFREALAVAERAADRSSADAMTEGSAGRYGCVVTWQRRPNSWRRPWNWPSASARPNCATPPC